MTTRAARLWGALTALALLATAPMPAAAQPKTEVRLAMLAPSSLLWLHAIARDQGFYEKRNLDVKDLLAANSPALVQAVATGSVEAGVAVADLAMRAIDKDAPIIISGSVLGHSILRLVGTQGINTPAELSGKPVTAGGVQGGTANLLKYLVKTAGGDAKSLQLVAMANSKDRIVAMQNGQVKGALLIAPFDTQAERLGMKILGDYLDDYQQTPLMLNRIWAEKNRPAAEALTQAFQEAAGWINTPANKQKAIAILATYTKVEPDICAESYVFIVEQQKAIPADLGVTEASLKNLLVIDNAVSDNPVSLTDFKLERYYDPSFRAAAK